MVTNALHSTVVESIGRLLYFIAGTAFVLLALPVLAVMLAWGSVSIGLDNVNTGR